MRIPNQLQGDPLYRSKRSGGGRSNHSDPSWRRVIRLAVVLALVVVLMQQAAKPGVYQVFFPQAPQSVVPPAESADLINTLSDPLAFESSDLPTSSASPREPAALPAELNNPAQLKKTAELEKRDVSKLATDFVTERESGELVQVLADWTSNQPAPDLPDWAATEAGQAALAGEIQRKLINEAKDGTVWRAADTPALMASLALHRPSAPKFNLLRKWQGPAEVAGVLPLLQQPSIYRGKTLIAKGDVVQVEKITGPKNQFGLEHYFNLWLVPKDASARPWLIIVAELPKEMLGLVDQTTSDADPKRWPVTSPYPLVNVRGEFIKRLSYQSASSAELTPVVVGHVESIQANGNKAISIARSIAGGSETSVSQRTSLFGAFALAIASGVLFASWVMWRTAKLNQQLRERRQRKSVKIELLILACVSWFAPTTHAESVLDLMPGFTPSQLESIVTPVGSGNGDSQTPVDDVTALSMDAKPASQLIYRFSRLSESVLQSRHGDSVPTSSNNIGDAVYLNGTIRQSRTLAVPDELVDILEFSTIELLNLSDGAGNPMFVLMRSMSVDMQEGDRLFGSGALIGTVHGARVFVAGRLAWSPQTPSSPSASVLSSHGVDLSRLADVAKADRKPLTREDAGIFFSMIGATRRVQDSVTDVDVQAMRQQTLDASAVDLLKNPRDFIGQWISLNVETVRITRVVVESEQRQADVGGLFYYQIDAIGDLGNVQLQIEVPEGEPVLMENRYPVTIVSAKLPKFLQDKEGDWVSTITAPVRIEGWFYRLWSYESDFMESRGGKQIAPLIIGGVIEDRRSRSSDPIGVKLIGKTAAFGIIAGIISTILFGWYTRRGDRESRRRRTHSFSDEG